MSTEILRKIQELDNVQAGDFADEGERFAAKETVRRLLRRLETPLEQTFTFTFDVPVLIAAIETFLNLGIWQKWKESIDGNDETARDIDNIIAMCNASVDPRLLRRLLRQIAASNILEEVDVDTWKPTPLSLALGDKSSHLAGMIEWGSHSPIPTGANLPKFLKKHGYQEPRDPQKLDNHTELFGQTFFDMCTTDPIKNETFMEMMTAWQMGKVDWTQVYDTNRIVNGADLSKPLLVDVGGMHGIDMQRFLSCHPDLPNDTLFVQDMPHVLESEAHAIDERIKKVPHDFFAPQTILNARGYFFHAVPHDWSDADCLRIFQNITPVMKRGYSKMLIYEVVLPPKGANGIQASMDGIMMLLLSSMERTEQHWAELLGQAGLKIVDIFRRPGASESVIEAELA